MFASWQRKLVTSMVFSTVLGISAGSIPAATSAPGPCDSVCTAKRLLRAFYPDLRGKDAAIRVGGESALDLDGPLVFFNVDVSAPAPNSPDMIVQVSASFQVSPESEGTLLMQSKGAEVNDEKRKDLEEIVGAHPEWSEAQINQALEGAGAKFGPYRKEALVLALPTKDLEPFLGKIHVDSADFRVRSKSEQPAPLLDWAVNVTATKGGKSIRYYLLLEPFSGRVYSFDRVRETP